MKVRDNHEVNSTRSSSTCLNGIWIPQVCLLSVLAPFHGVRSDEGNESVVLSPGNYSSLCVDLGYSFVVSIVSAAG
jgi:hypothetical protein